MAHIGRIFADEAGMLRAMRPAHQILGLNPPGTATVCLPLSSSKLRVARNPLAKVWQSLVMKVITMNWELLSIHFRQTLAGGYRYLDKCGEFIVEAEREFDFTPREIKPSGAILDIPEIALKADVDSDGVAVMQELPDRDSRFLEITIGLVELAWKHFSPSSALRNGMASKWLRKTETEESAARLSLAQMHPVADQIADVAGMTPYSFNGAFSLKSGSRTLNISVSPGALESTRRVASAPIGSTAAARKKQERRNLQAERRGPLSGFASILEIDLQEEDPPITSHGKQLTALFKQLQEHEQALKTFFQRHV